MLASLLRRKEQKTYAEDSPFRSPSNNTPENSPLLENGHGGSPSRNGLAEHSYDGAGEGEGAESDVNVDDDDEDNPHSSTPLLPIFSVSHLGR